MLVEIFVVIVMVILILLYFKLPWKPFGEWIYKYWKAVWISLFISLDVLMVVIFLYSYYFLENDLFRFIWGGMSIVSLFILIVAPYKLLSKLKPNPKLHISSIKYSTRPVPFKQQGFCTYAVEPPAIDVHVHNKSKYVSGSDIKVMNTFIEDLSKHATIEPTSFRYKGAKFNIATNGEQRIIEQIPQKLIENQVYKIHVFVSLNGKELHLEKYFRIHK